MINVMIAIQLTEEGKISVHTGGLDDESIADMEKAVGLLESTAMRLRDTVLFELKLAARIKEAGGEGEVEG